MGGRAKFEKPSSFLPLPPLPACLWRRWDSDGASDRLTYRSLALLDLVSSLNEEHDVSNLILELYDLRLHLLLLFIQPFGPIWW